MEVGNKKREVDRTGKIRARVESGNSNRGKAQYS